MGKVKYFINIERSAGMHARERRRRLPCPTSPWTISWPYCLQLALSAQEKLKDYHGLYKFQLPHRQCFIRLENGLVTVEPETEEYPNCIIITDEKQLMDLINGKTSPMKALLFGKVRIQGDVKPLLQLCALL